MHTPWGPVTQHSDFQDASPLGRCISLDVSLPQPCQWEVLHQEAGSDNEGNVVTHSAFLSFVHEKEMGLALSPKGIAQ